MARKKKEAAVEAAEELIDGGGTMVVEEDEELFLRIHSRICRSLMMTPTPGRTCRSATCWS